MYKIIAQQYQEVRKLTQSICSLLQPEDTVLQPIIDVSPPKWHLGHTTWFFENFILANTKGYHLHNPTFNWFLNSYYESQGPRIYRGNRGNMSRPLLSDIMAYRTAIDVAILQLLQTESLDNIQLQILQLGLQHEQQHQELLVTDIKYILGHNPLYPSLGKATTGKALSGIVSTNVNALSKFSVPDGMYTIGAVRNDAATIAKDFRFDNESNLHQHYIDIVDISNWVTNRQYLAFMAAGGYSDYRFWLAEGLDWVRNNNIEAPLYWVQLDGHWHTYTFNGLQPLELDAPLTHVCYYEADAFATFSNAALPSEFEWEAAASIYPTISPNVNAGYLPDIAPIITEAFSGNLWCHTKSAYLPYKGYHRTADALGEYNGKFMINQMALRGGSCATPKHHCRATYRNFFHPDKRWQFTGIRLAT